MYDLNDIGLSWQHREDVTRQIEKDRLARRLRAFSRMNSGTASALASRVFTWSLRRRQAAEC
jgi:hypothetical protein